MNIHTALAMLVPDQGVMNINAVPENPAEIVAQARNNSRGAFKDRDLTALAVTEAEDSLARVQAMIEAEGIAENELQDAQAAAVKFTTEWVSRGARANEPQSDPNLVAAVTVATQWLADARVRADGAREALPIAEAALRQARNDFENAAHYIGEAGGTVMDSMAEDDYATIAKAVSLIIEPMKRIEALAAARMGNWTPFSNDAAASQLLNRLDALLPGPARRGDALKRANDLTDQVKAWRELGKRLMENPDAE